MNTFTYYSPAVAPLLTDVLWYALEEREQSSYHFSLKMAELPMLSDEAVKKWNWEAREITAEVRAIDWLLQLYNEDINEYLLSEQLKEDGLIDVICKCIGREYIKKELCNHPRLLLDMTHHYRNVIPLEMIRALQTQKQWTYVCNEPGAIEGFYSYKLTSEALCLTYNTLQRNSLVPENDFHHGIQTWVARECSIQQNRFKLSQKKEFPGFVRDVSLDKSTCIEFIKIFFVSHRTFLISHSQYVDFTEADRFDVAMTLLHFAPGRVVYNIRDFDLSEQNRYFLAINLAAIKDTDIMYRLQDFKITNRSDRFTIAKIAAKTNPLCVMCHLDKIGELTEIERVELAELCLETNQHSTVRLVSKLQIQDQMSRYKLALKYAKACPIYTARALGDFNLSKKQIFEVAKVIVTDTKIDMSDYSEIDMQSAQDIYELAKINVAKFPNTLLSWCRRIDDDALAINLINTTLATSINPSNLFRESMYCLSEQRNIPHTFEWHADQLMQIYALFDEVKGEPNLKWRNVGIDLSWDRSLKQLIKYRNKKIVASLFSAVIALNQDPHSSQIYQQLVMTPPRVHLLLPMLMIAKWESMRKKSNLSEEALLIRNKLLSMRDPLRNHCKPLIQAWHLCMIELNHADITAEIKLSIVSQIVSGPMQDLVKSLYYLLSIISGSPGLLPNHLGENPVETLKKLCEMTLKSDPYLDLSGVENLSEKFRATFAQMRVPAGWKVYERVLITLDDQNVQKEFNRFFISVLEGRHPEERYRTEVEINSHLHHIEKNAPDVLTKWRNGGEQERVMTDDSGSKPFSFTDFLLEKSGDNHWHKDGVDQLPHLTSYLKTGKIDTNTSFFEKVCIELCQDSQITVDKIQAVISSFGQPDLEFANDLAGLTIQFQTKIKAGQVVTIVDTDDWEDLLLCGTEVSESCQRIDGNVINKCLLAYIMDGKNRMIAIKGPRGKLISRAMLRLLWDDTENKPILYLDRIYGVKSSIFLEREIKAYAKKRAVALGCRLSTSYLYNARPTLVKSLGSCVPFEYFDSGGGVIENGITEFTVSYVESD